jgi:hypothetical protein
MVFVHVLRVGHIDIHDPIKKPDHFHRFITGAVINNGEAKAHPDRLGQGGQDLGGVVCRCDEIDVMAAHLLEPFHGPGHIRGVDEFPPSFVADVIILAEEASEAAVGEEDRP